MRREASVHAAFAALSGAWGGAEHRLDPVHRAGGADGEQVAGDAGAVAGEGAEPLVDAFGVLDADVEGGAAEPAEPALLAPRGGDAGIDREPVVIGLDAEDVLGDRVVVPRRGAGEPGIFRFPGPRRLLARDHLRVDVGLELAHGRVFLPRSDE